MAKKGGSKQKKMNSRVDFTPMVDMIMLLVTFFMLCTTLLKPQTMEISMPSDKDDIKEENRSQIAASKAITILIDENNTLYYFKGKPDGGDMPDEGKLFETTYGKDGLRKVLLSSNVEALKAVQKLKEEFSTKKTSNVQQEQKVKAEYKERLSKIKNAENTPSVVIKASDKATYDNLIQVLDEMQICSIGRYVIDKFVDGDKAKIAALKNGTAGK